MAWEEWRQRQGQAFKSQKSYWGEAVLTHPRDADGPAPGAQSCLAGLREHGKGRSALPSPPAQTVLNEKDKLRDCTALCTFTYGFSKENDPSCSAISEANLMGQVWDSIAPVYVHP